MKVSWDRQRERKVKRQIRKKIKMTETVELKNTGRTNKEDQGNEGWIGAGRRGKTEKL